jgi:hypothetical protein
MSGTLADAGGPFPGWESFLPQFVHPVKVAVVEVLLYMGEPLSAAQLARLFSGEGDGFRESNVRYHLRHLAKVGVLDVVPSDPFSEGSHPEKLFYFANRKNRGDAHAV